MRSEVAVESGRLSGTLEEGGVRAFKGIPYAAAPVGDLRWRPPQPVAPWSGVRAADAFGPRCIQPSRAARSIGNFGPERESEDCLFLNVWTAARLPEERRPVMVWFHGGAFYLGSGAVPLFDGTGLARQGIVLVTVNYRLGRLGFLAHRDLTRESTTGGSGNYGLLDQIAALRWVQQNIAAFGGDPDRVTIFGQSAGAVSVSCHMISPFSKGLFQRAIGQSSGAFGPVGATSGTGDCIQSLDAAERSGEAFAGAIGAGSIGELRALPARDIQLARPGATDTAAVHDPSQAKPGAFDTAWPVVDGRVLPDGGFAIFRQGRQNDVALITGSNGNEGATMPSLSRRDAFEDHARREYGALTERFGRLYPAADDAQARHASRSAVGYRNFNWQNWTWARLQAQSGRSPVFHYCFNHAPPIPADADYFENPAADFGAFHGAEIPYIFRNLAVRNWPWQEHDRRLSTVISSYWMNFAASGDPNGAGLPEWPRFSDATAQSMVFAGRIAPMPTPEPEAGRLAFWDEFYAARRG